MTVQSTFKYFSFESVREFLQIEGLLMEDEEVVVVATTCRDKIWNVFEHPESSTLVLAFNFNSKTNRNLLHQKN